MPEYHSLSFTHEEIDYLLGRLNELLNNEKKTLTPEEYNQLLSTVKFVKNFNGDYNNLSNKPQLPDSLSQFKNDMGYSQIDLDAIEDWVTMLINESEISYEGKYAEKHSVDNLIEIIKNLQKDIDDLNKFIRRTYATKEYVQENKYELQPHKHESYQIKSCLQDPEVFTIEDDFKALDKKFIEYKAEAKKYALLLKETKDELSNLTNSLDVVSTYYDRQLKHINGEIEKKSDKDHTHEEFDLIKNINLDILDDNLEHHNRTVLDALDSASLQKWNATSKFVGNIETIKLNGIDSDKFLEGWTNANSKITTIDVGGIPAGSNLEGKTICDIFKMLFYPDLPPILSVEMDPKELSFEVGKDNLVLIKSITAYITTQTNPIKHVKFYIDGVLKETRTTDVATGGALVFDINETIYSEVGVTIEPKYKIRIEDIKGLGAEALSPSIVFCYPMFYGVVDPDINLDNIEESDILEQTKIISDKTNKTITYSASNQSMFFAYPSEYGLLSSIVDINGFDISKSFNYKKINLTINGSIINYYIYMNNINSNTNFNIIYRF